MTGTDVPAMAGLDTAMEGALQKYSVAGGALSVSYNGRLVFAHGYGCADTQSNTPVQPDSLFRMASVSKTFTAVGILLLVQQGKLSLDASVFGSILTDYTPLPGKTINPNLMQITVRHLLEHTGGWDRSTTQNFNGTPYHEPFNDLLAAAAVAEGHAQPATDADVIGVMLSQPLQHAPGAYYAYSNFGYVLLGRVIEHVSGMGYEQYVQQNILKPLGIGRQKLGATTQSDVANGEVTYYDPAGAPLIKSVFPDVTARVPAPYGGHFLEDVDSAGAWVTTTMDMTRFLNGIDGRGSFPALLTNATLAQMQVDPKVQNEGPGSFYGLGFIFQQVAAGLRWTKDGGFAGTSSYVVHSPAGYTWSVVFNGSPGSDSSTSSSEDSGGSLISDTVAQIETILGQVNSSSTIPKNDLYGSFKSTLLTPTFSAKTPVVQGATFQPGIVSGSWVAITGQNLATATRTWWNDEIVGNTLPVEIDHVRVTINGKNAAIYYVSPTQLNVQAPTDSTLGPVNIQVTRDGTTSAVIQADYVAAAPGFFTFPANGKSYAAGVHLSGAYVGDIAGTLPAKPGETIELYATGLGASTGGVVAPTATAPTQPLVTVTIGGVPATVQFSGLVYPGEWQLNVVVPQVAAGPQPITISSGSATSAVAAVLAVAAPQ
ncbi:MAG TPA: serine hydrolase [Bryobacteraceae bacterium]